MYTCIMYETWTISLRDEDVQKQLNNLVSQNRDGSWLNGIQYMDYKPRARIDHTKRVEDVSSKSRFIKNISSIFIRHSHNWTKIEVINLKRRNHHGEAYRKKSQDIYITSWY